ncbi:MAG: DUF3325 domain-containing protein [Ferrovibrionaceae bacterium]
MLALIGLAYAGLAWLCLAMDRHHRQVTGAAVGAAFARSLRLAGSVALALSFAAAVAADGWSFGPVAWFGGVTAAGLALVLQLPYRPRLAVGLSLAGCLVAILDVAAGALLR